MIKTYFKNKDKIRREKGNVPLWIALLLTVIAGFTALTFLDLPSILPSPEGTHPSDPVKIEPSPPSSAEVDFENFPDDIRYCEVDADCVLVKENCGCLCSGCGPDFDTSISRKYLTAWNEALESKCPPGHADICPMVCCDEARPICTNNVCSYVKDDAVIEIEVY